MPGSFRIIPIIAILLLLTGTVQPASARTKTLAPILLYHHIDPKFTHWNVPPQKFERQLMFLAANHYRTINMAAYMDAFEKGETLPDKTIVLTFDDSYMDNYLYAFPLLKRYGLTGTFFIITEAVGKPGYMTWDQIIEMKNAGMEMGAHTLHHPFLTHLSAVRAFIEIYGSKLELQWHLKIPISIFAYPYNDHNSRVVNLVKWAGFRGAVTVSPHKGDVPHDEFEIDRATVTSGEGMNTFAMVVGERVKG